LAYQYEKITNIRRDATQKLTSSLVSRFDRISIEDLHVNGMLKNHTLAKHLADASFGDVRRQLTYKAELYGNMLNVVARFFPSSKQCSCCGNINAELTLTDRTYICKVCGMVKDRDLNAAINLEQVGRAHSEPTNACGHDGSVSVAHKAKAASIDETGREEEQ
jgi:putative transposase